MTVHTAWLFVGQGFYKPLDWAGKKSAVAMLNAATTTAIMSFNFKDIPGLTCTK